MDTVIARIIEIEKRSAMDIEQAEAASQARIAEHQRALEEEKDRLQTRLIAEEEQRRTEAIRAVHDRIKNEFLEVSKGYEIRFRDADFAAAVKEKIMAILLAR